MIENVLEIFVFTYNRAASLGRTLEQFAEGPLKNCSLTVLDNHSTDATAETCRSFLGRLPRLNIVRHPKNIGGLANYLRGIELAKAQYTWVICDDDSYDFAQFGDILATLLGGETDLVSVGVEGHAMPGGLVGSLASVALEQPFFLSHSFVPSLIFRTSLFTPELIRLGYDNVDTMFPHFPFLAALVQRNATIYVSRGKVIRKSATVGYSTFRFLAGWIKSCRKAPRSPARAKAVSEVFGGAVFFKNLLYCVLTEKTFRPLNYWPEYKELFGQTLLFGLFLAVKVVLFLPLVLAPKGVHRLLWAWYSRYRAKKGMPLPVFDEER